MISGSPRHLAEGIGAEEPRDQADRRRKMKRHAALRADVAERCISADA